MSLSPRVTVVIPCRNDAEFLRAVPRGAGRADAPRRPRDRRRQRQHRRLRRGRPPLRRRPVRRGGHRHLAGGRPRLRRGAGRRRHHRAARCRLSSAPDWIARLVRAFVADPHLGVLTGGAEFYGAGPVVSYLGEHWYIGGGHFWIKKWLGIPLVFGSNFAMRARVWERVRDQVDRTNAKIHDDLDLTIRLRASTASATTPSCGCRSRRARSSRSAGCGGASGASCRPSRRAGPRARRGTVASSTVDHIPDAAPAADEGWPPIDEGWAPGFGR